MDIPQAIANISGIITIVSAIIAIVQSVRAWNEKHPGQARSGMNRFSRILRGGLLLFIGIAIFGDALGIGYFTIRFAINAHTSQSRLIILLVGLILAAFMGWSGFFLLKKGRVYQNVS